MSNLNDLFNDIGLENVTGIKTAGDVFGTLADLSGAVGFVQLGISLIESFSSQDDELKQVLNAIQADFKQLSDQVAQLSGQVAASDKLQRMRDIDQGINAAVGVFEQLQANLSSTPPVSQDFKQSQIQTCLDAVLFFTDYDDKWQVVGTDLPYYSDAWSGTLAPQVGSDGLVFSYTYTLPQFLRAIYIFLTAIAAFDPTSLKNYQSVLNKCLQRLESVHDTIVSSGIIGTRIPPEEGVGQPGLWLYGAVEIYSGANIVGSYQSELADRLDLSAWPAFERTNFFNLLQLRILRRKKELYTQIGLPIVRQVINQLRQITGQPALTGVAYEAWSVEELFSTLNIPVPQNTGNRLNMAFPDNDAIESALASFLRETPPYISYAIIGEPDGRSGNQRVAPALPLPKGSLYTFLTGASLGPVFKVGDTPPQSTQASIGISEHGS